MEKKLSFQQLNLNWEDFVTDDVAAESFTLREYFQF